MTEQVTVPLDSEEIERLQTKWEEKGIGDLAEKGWTYRKKTKSSGAEYMCVRFKNQERSIGRYNPETEKILFKTFPKLAETTKTRGRPQKAFLSVPIKRVAVVPRDYKPIIEVLRYWQIFKNNGFPGDFSDFINGNLMDHFVKCNGIILPILLNPEEKVEA